MADLVVKTWWSITHRHRDEFGRDKVNTHRVWSLIRVKNLRQANLISSSLNNIDGLHAVVCVRTPAERGNYTIPIEDLKRIVAVLEAPDFDDDFFEMDVAGHAAE